MENAKPKKYTPFSGAPKPKYNQNSFSGASKPKDHNSGFNKGGGEGDPTIGSARRRGKK